jgi:hypothetical protein
MSQQSQQTQAPSSITLAPAVYFAWVWDAKHGKRIAYTVSHPTPHNAMVTRFGINCQITSMSDAFLISRISVTVGDVPMQGCTLPAPTLARVALSKNSKLATSVVHYSARISFCMLTASLQHFYHSICQACAVMFQACMCASQAEQQSSQAWTGTLTLVHLCRFPIICTTIPSLFSMRPSCCDGLQRTLQTVAASLQETHWWRCSSSGRSRRLRSSLPFTAFVNQILQVHQGLSTVAALNSGPASICTNKFPVFLVFYTVLLSWENTATCDPSSATTVAALNHEPCPSVAWLLVTACRVWRAGRKDGRAK